MIEMSEEEWRRAFPIWLRTGTFLSYPNGNRVECKFNPWHDPENGRLTFSGTGRYHGGGGSFGGGGATGTWKRSEPKNISITQKRRSAAIVPAGQSSGNGSARPAPSASEASFRAVTRNGYTYHIDSRERTRRVSGALTVADVPIRSRASQRQAGGPNAGRVTMAVITSRRASMAQPRRSTILRRMPTSFGAGIACLRMSGRETSVPGGLSRSKSFHGLTEPLFDHR